MTNEQFKALLLKFKQQKLSREELDLFLDKAAEPHFEALLGDELLQSLVTDQTSMEEPELREQLWLRLAPASTQIPEQSVVRKMPVRWWKWVAAAAAMAITGTIVWKFNTPKDKDQLAVQTQKVKDIIPGSNSAILTLSDGSTIVLDSAAEGNLVVQGGTRVIKSGNGELSYQAEGVKANTGNEVLYNTMTTPRGSQYQLTLPDGTKVWLNAASSITYPTAFAGKERLVKVTGEAYFEVQPDKSQPFLVNVNDKSIVQVLGTAFNINAYNNEESINTTLLQGAVKVGRQADANAVLLKPGEQAQQQQGDIKVLKDVDQQKVMAWRTGLFDFNNSSLDEVMREIARWYDIEVVYEQQPPEIEFVGKISRKLTLQQVLNGLQGTGFKFRIENNRKLVILP